MNADPRPFAILLALALVALVPGCGPEASRRSHEACLFVDASQGEVEALLGEVLANAELMAELSLQTATESEQGGLEAGYGDHWLGLYVTPDESEGRLRVWCWSSRHSSDAHAVRSALERVLEGRSVPFVMPGAGS